VDKSNILSYDPKNVMKHFYQICQIPHTSFHIEKLSQFLATFFKKANCEVTVDDAMNVFVKIPASKGFEKLPLVTLQAHMDMVGVKSNDCTKNLLKDPIEPYVDHQG